MQTARKATACCEGARRRRRRAAPRPKDRHTSETRGQTAKAGQASSDLNPPATASARHHLALSGSISAPAGRPRHGLCLSHDRSALESSPGPWILGHSVAPQAGTDNDKNGPEPQRHQRQPPAPHPGPAPARRCMQACRWAIRAGTGERTAASATTPKQLPRSGTTKTNAPVAGHTETTPHPIAAWNNFITEA
jgi:hypothetical protein